MNRTHKDEVRRNLILFVYQLYKRDLYKCDSLGGYCDPTESKISEAFSAYHEDPVFYAIFNELKHGFRELIELESGRE